MFTYKAYQLCIQSEFEIPGFPAGQDTDVVDVRVGLGSVDPLPEGELPWRVQDPDHFIQTVPKLGSFKVEGGQQIILQPATGSASGDLGLFARATPLAVLLMQRGSVVFHGSAVDSPQGAKLLLGELSSGKSVMTTALVRKGYPLLCDEFAVLRLNNDMPEVIPSCPEFRLWAEALRELGRDPDRLSPIRPKLSKFSRKAGNWASHPRPLTSLTRVHLGKQKIFEALSSENLYTILDHYVYRFRILEAMGRLPELKRLKQAITRTVRALQVTIPIDWKALEEFADKIDAGPTSVESPDPQQELKPFGFLGKSLPHPPLFVGKPGWIILASFPKSGNTWVRALLTAWRMAAAEPSEGPPPLEALDGFGALNCRHFFDEMTSINSDHLYFRTLDTLRPTFYQSASSLLEGPTVVKTHDHFSARGERYLFEAKTVSSLIYVVRNPLDVIGSYASHFQFTLEQSVNAVLNGSVIHDREEGDPAITSGMMGYMPYVLLSWHDHVASWVDQSEVPVLVVRYEDLLRQGTTEFRRILEHLDMPLEEKRIQAAVQGCDFETLHHEEKEKGFGERLGSTFFRVGRAGSWRQNLPPELAQEICDRCGPMMRRMGYGKEVDEVLATWSKGRRD